jgi:hypothetical protein
VPSSIPKTSVSRGRAYHCRADADSEVVGPRIHRDRAIAKLAAHQRGVVTRDQLREIGMTSDTIDHWLGSARLHSLYRGVYLLGHAGVTDGARELGAVLACGPGAVLSYRSAAWLWRLLAQPSEAHDVTVPGRKLASRRGIRIHWVPALDPRDVRSSAEYPSPRRARTILDLAAVVKPRVLEQAIAETYARRLARRSEPASLLARRSSRPGTRPSAPCSTMEHLLSLALSRRSASSP